MNFLVLNFNSWFNMVIWKSESALLKILFLSERWHRFTIILMRSWNMRVFRSIKNGTLGIAETPPLFFLIEVFNCSIFDIIKTYGGSSGLDRAESMFLPKTNWWDTIPQSVRRLVIWANKPFRRSQVLYKFRISYLLWTCQSLEGNVNRICSSLELECYLDRKFE